jgi:hypothetical protein
MRDCPSSRATLRGFTYALPLERPDIMPIYADLATLFARNVNVTELIANEAALALSVSRPELQTYNPDDRILHYHGQQTYARV